MVKKELIVFADYSDVSPVSLDELCEICHVSVDFIHDMIEYEILHPEGSSPDQWFFDMNELRRVKTALRLRHDLEINLAGISVVLDLLDEMERLRTRLAVFERHFSKLP